MSRGWAAVAVLTVILGAAATPAYAISEEDERAKAHYLAGQSYYDQASYTDALREFNEAYRISKRPALLYDIARSFEALGQLGDAVSMLERYLTEEPTTPDRPAIETRIRNLKERQAEAMRLKRPPSEPTEPSRPPTLQPTTHAAGTARPTPLLHRKRLWTWILGGAGIGIVAAAAGTGISSQLAYNDLNSQCGAGHCPATVTNAQSRIDRGRSLAVATDVLWPVGAATVAAGVALFFVEGRHPATAAKRAQLTPFVTPSSGGLLVARDF